MALPAIEIRDVRARLDAESLVRRQPQVVVDAVILRLSERGLTLVLPPGAPLAVDRITQDRVLFRVNIRGVEGIVHAQPRVTPSGRLRVELVSVRALFLPFFPVPLSLVGEMIGRFLPRKPGLFLGEGNQIEIDLAVVLREGAGLEALHLPPLRAVGAGDGVVELRFWN